MSLSAQSTAADLNVLTSALTFEQALELCDFALALNPQNIEPYLAGISIYERYQRERELGLWLDRALKVHPRNIALLEKRTTVYGYEGNHDLALVLWKRVITLDSAYDPDGSRLANLYLSAGDIGEALPRFRKLAEEHMVRATMHRQARIIYHQYGDALLRSGDPNGFIYYSNLLNSPHGAFYEVPGLPWWDAHDIAGKRLLVTHQLGYGDQFLLAAVIPFLRERDCEVYMTCDHLVAELLVHVFGHQHVLPLLRPFTNEVTAPPELLAFCEKVKPDLQVTLLHLPIMAQKFGAKPNEFFTPYILAPEQTVIDIQADTDAILQAAAGRIIVGVAWDCVQRNHEISHGTYQASFAHNRSVPTTVIAGLTDDPEIANKYYFVSLVHPAHYEYFPAELPKNMEHLRHAKYRYSETATLIQLCDFVIAVNSSVANLSCAQGQETWVPLHQQIDWRYAEVGDHSPWMPTARLFRQRVPGDWEGVFSSIRTAMLARVQNLTIPCVIGDVTEALSAQSEY